MNRSVVRFGPIAALCYVSVNMTTEVITHPHVLAEKLEDRLTSAWL
ncbi:MAG TPA: hypothetical protein VGG63_16595 [Steroidobacteraceae bacterium]